MRHGFTLIELMIVIAIIAIIAAIAIPNLMESRVTANEAAASASLKSGVFPGQVQFQSGSYQDADEDNVGEYATLGALTGLQASNKLAKTNGTSGIKLLQGPLANQSAWTAGTGITAPASGVASGYRFAAYAGSGTTPPGAGGTLDAGSSIWYEGCEATVPVTAAAVLPAGVFGAAGAATLAGAQLAAGDTANNGEKYWVAIAVPERFGDTGRRPFFISQDGQIRSPAKAGGINVCFGTARTAPGTFTTPPVNGDTPVAADIGFAVAITLDTRGYVASPMAYTDIAGGTLTVTMFDGNAGGTKMAGTPTWEIFAK